jgi:UDP:flavonoid glycosyltransferase YjiC (YdhE family)
VSPEENHGRSGSLKFLFFPLSYVLAHVVRMVETAKVLRSSGHEVVFACEPSSTPDSKSFVCQQEGFRVIPRKDPDIPWLRERFLKYGFGITLWDLFRHQKWAPLDIAIDEQVELIRREKPDAVVGDGTFCLGCAAYISGVPMAGILNSYAARFYRPMTFNRCLIDLWNYLFLEPIRRPIYAKHGSRPVNAMQLLRETPLISPDLPELCDDIAEYPKWSAVGPIMWSPRNGRPSWLDDIDDGRPNVYITMGSTGALDTFLRTCFPTMGASPYRFVVTTAGQVTAETVAMAPDNFIIEEYASGAEILKHCDALIYHGGNGSMYQGLAAGRPMIAVPFHFEQSVNAKTGVKHGFGIHIPARKVTGERVMEALRELLSKPCYRHSAEKFSGAIRESRGAELTAEILVEVALRKKNDAAVGVKWR